MEQTFGSLEPQSIKFKFDDFIIKQNKPKIKCHPRKQEQISVVLGFPTIKKQILENIWRNDFTDFIW